MSLVVPVSNRTNAPSPPSRVFCGSALVSDADCSGHRAIAPRLGLGLCDYPGSLGPPGDRAKPAAYIRFLGCWVVYDNNRPPGLSLAGSNTCPCVIEQETPAKRLNNDLGDRATSRLSSSCPGWACVTLCLCPWWRQGKEPHYRPGEQVKGWLASRLHVCQCPMQMASRTGHLSEAAFSGDTLCRPAGFLILGLVQQPWRGREGPAPRSLGSCFAARWPAVAAGLCTLWPALQLGAGLPPVGAEVLVGSFVPEVRVLAGENASVFPSVGQPPTQHTAVCPPRERVAASPAQLYRAVV